MIPLAEPVLDGNEWSYLRECLKSSYVSSVGPFVSRFEAELAEAVGVGHAVACSSGTAALHVALRLAGAKAGELVAVSDFTFIASANAIAYTGADVWLIDSEPQTFNMNTELLYDEFVRRARLGRRLPSVVEVVHVLGHPARMEPLLALRETYGLRIVEDAAESLGASWTSGACAGRQVGSVGDLGCFSFNGNKIMTTGGGGAIVTNGKSLADSARHLTNQAKAGVSDYRHDDIGYNYRLTNIAAALGVAQLERLPEFVRRKRSIASLYRTGLRSLPVTEAPWAAWGDPSFWLYSVLLAEDSRTPSQLVRHLEMKGVQARRVWPPVHAQKPYASTERLGGEVAEEIYRQGISLPSSTQLHAEEQETVMAAMRRFFE